MEFKEQKLKGVFEITFDPKWDERGFFMRTYDIKEYEKPGLNREWVQENHSFSEKKGIIRGLHLQLPPFAEAKLVRCVRGSVFDVFVEENFKAVLIPRGFAHGYCTLTDKSAVQYKVDNYYTPSQECGLVWNDPDINIAWPVSHPVISAKDAASLTLKEFISKHHSVKILS
jgi:dTDP-4-dehydrorhamnose 3,5-epimerase